MLYSCLELDGEFLGADWAGSYHGAGMKRLTCLTLCAVAAAGLTTRGHAQCQYELTVIQAGPPDCDPFPTSPTWGKAI